MQPRYCFTVPVACTRGVRSGVSIDLNNLVRKARADGHARITGVDEAVRST